MKCESQHGSLVVYCLHLYELLKLHPINVAQVITFLGCVENDGVNCHRLSENLPVSMPRYAAGIL